MFVYMYMCVHVCMIAYVYEYVYLSIYVCVCVYVYMVLHVYKYMRVYVYMFVYVSGTSLYTSQVFDYSVSICWLHLAVPILAQGPDSPSSFHTQQLGKCHCLHLAVGTDLRLHVSRKSVLEIKWRLIPPLSR